MDGGPDPSLFKTIVERSIYVYAVVDRDTRLTYVSPACQALFGYSPEELIGELALDLVVAGDRGTVIASLADLVERPGQGVPIVVGIEHRDGSIVSIEIGATIGFDDPAIDGILLRLRDYNDQRLLYQYLEALATSVPVERTLEPLVGSIKAQHLTSEVALAYDWDGARFTSTVDTGLPPELTGVADPAGAASLPWVDALRTGRPAIVAGPNEIDPVLRDAADAAGLVACWAYPVPVPPDGARLACLIVWRGVAGGPTLGHDTAIEHSVWLAALGFGRRHSEDLLRHAAMHDTLTGIPNRSYFFESLDAVLTGSDPGHTAVLFADLDGFKVINDTHGHGVGDDVLAIVAERLQDSVRPGDIVARVGGDEFAVLCTGLQEDEDAIGLADRLIEVVGRPIRIGGVDASVGISIGVAFHDPAGGLDRPLIDAADGALYQAKQAGRNRRIVARSA